MHDCDATAHGLSVPVHLDTGEGSFSWNNYPNIGPRYDATALANMRAATARSFDGSNWLEKDTAAATDYAITFVCLFKTSAVSRALLWTGDKSVVDEEQALIIDGSGNLAAWSQNAGGSASATVTAASANDDAWHFGAAVLTSAASRTCRLDDETPVSNTTSITVTGVYDRTSLGIYGRSVRTGSYIGDVQNALIFDVALTAAQLDWLYNSGDYRTISELSSSTDTDNPGTTNLVGAYQLSEEDGAAYDHSGNGLHLATDGDAQAAEFVSSNSEYLETDTAAFTAYDATMVCWLKSSSTAEQTAMWVGDKDAADVWIRIGIDSAGDALLGRIQSGGAEDQTTGANIDDGNWHMVGCTLGGATDANLYVDDNSPVTDATSVTISGFDRTALGRTADSSPGNYFNGEIDHAMIWRLKLTTAQMTWLYNNGDGRTRNELIFSLHLDNPGLPFHLWTFSGEAGGDSATDRGTAVVGDLDLADGNGAGRTTGHIVSRPVPVAGVKEQTASVEVRATEFNGVDQQLNKTSTSFRGSDAAGTIAIWFKAQNLSANKYLFGARSSANDRIDVRLDTAGSLSLVLNVDAGGEEVVTYSTGRDDNQWHLILWKSDGTSHYASIDGGSFADQSSSGDWFGDLGTTATAVYIAAESDNTDYFPGTIGPVMYFTDELDNTDASELYNDRAGVVARDLIDGTVALTSGYQPIHAWDCSSNDASGTGTDIGTTGGLDLTSTNGPINTVGIPAGATKDGTVVRLLDVASTSYDAMRSTFVEYISAVNYIRLLRPFVVRVSDGNGFALKFDADAPPPIYQSGVMVSTAFDASYAQPNSYFLILNALTARTQTRFVDGIATAAQAGIGHSGVNLILDAGLQATPSLGVDFGNLHNWAVIFNGASTKAYRDGGTAETVNAGGQNHGGVTIGGDWGGGIRQDMTLRHYVVNNGTLTDAQLDAIGEYLSNLHGLTWTAVT